MPLQIEENLNLWHDHLEEEFESYLNSYGMNSSTNDNVTSIDEYDVLGHEGYVEGATIEKFAEAWAQAGNDYLDYEEDYDSNFAASYLDQGDESGLGIRT